MIEDIRKALVEKMARAREALLSEYGSLRSGKASPGIVSRIRVDYYGNPTPIQQLATVTAPQPRMLVVSPYDKGALAAIEKAIQKENIGLNPSNDGKVIRIAIPPLNEETRKGLVKVVHQKAEEARVSARNIRRDANEEVKKLEKDGKASEDESRKALADIQKITDDAIRDITKTAENKEKELMEV
jgi:ribosome recycling factor